MKGSGTGNIGSAIEIQSGEQNENNAQKNQIGHTVETGTSYVIFDFPQHMFTKELIGMIPSLNPIQEKKKRRPDAVSGSSQTDTERNYV